jgi:hypothetical protein
MTLPPTTNEWSLRAEILEISHRWQQVFGLFLLGCLLGWGVAFVIPTPHRAQAEFYVAYNGDAIYRNSDDYKNWQFGELEAYVISNDVMGETLKRLGEQDAYWQDYDAPDLRPHLRTYWRNAGKWRLVADWPQQQKAEQLARTWVDVILEKTNQALLHAEQVLILETQLHLVTRDELFLQQDVVQLTEISHALSNWRQEHSQSAGAPLETLDRWQVQYLIANLAGHLPGDPRLQVDFPAAEAVGQAYFPLVEGAVASLDEHLVILRSQIEAFVSQREAIMAEWKVESAASHNLTVHLQIEPLADGVTPARPLRPTSQMALVGGGLAVLLWGFVWLGRPLRKGRR